MTMPEPPEIRALEMKHAVAIGKLRRQIWAKQEAARETCTHPTDAIAEYDADYSEANMSRPLRWRERRCMTCNSVLAKTVEVWVRTDAVGNPISAGGNFVKAPEQ